LRLSRFLLALGCALITISTCANSAQKAPLGKSLSKQYVAMREEDRALILVTFADKGSVDRYRDLSPDWFVSTKSVSRRAKVREIHALIDERDYPLNRAYVSAVREIVTVFRNELKWFNAVSAVATKRQIETLRSFPFVKEIELVGRWKLDRVSDQSSPSIDSHDTVHRDFSIDVLSYGPSSDQAHRFNLPAVHELGITGQGVTIAVLDDGFQSLIHETLDSINIVAQYDFVDRRPILSNSPAAGVSSSHGLSVLSIIGGYKPGQLIAPAFRSDYVIARVANASGNSWLEEDNVVRAMEWADSAGAEIVCNAVADRIPDSISSATDAPSMTSLLLSSMDRATELGMFVISRVRRSDESKTVTVDASSIMRVMANASRLGLFMGSGNGRNGYVFSRSESYGSALAAGIGALIISANPSLTPAQVQEALQSAVETESITPTVDAWKAVRHFGIMPMATLRGSVFEDANRNGVIDRDEYGFSGAIIRLTGIDGVDSMLTDASGDFEFAGIRPGKFRIELNPDDKFITTSQPGHYELTVLHRDNRSGYNFGIFRLGKIVGSVFEDRNRNGLRDSNESGLGGWTVLLSGPVTRTTVTNRDGSYSFAALLPGSYTMRESLQVNWLRTFPESGRHYSFEIATSGFDSTGFEFANFRKPDSVAASKRENGSDNALTFELEQNYPNPFNPVTVIRYVLPEATHVSLKIYNLLGNEVKSILEEYQSAGSKSVEINVEGLPSGVYFYKLHAGQYSDIKKMIVTK
jgi:hypothetical protein